MGSFEIGVVLPLMQYGPDRMTARAAARDPDPDRRKRTTRPRGGAGRGPYPRRRMPACPSWRTPAG